MEKTHFKFLSDSSFSFLSCERSSSSWIFATLRTSSSLALSFCGWIRGEGGERRGRKGGEGEGRGKVRAGEGGGEERGKGGADMNIYNVMNSNCIMTGVEQSP